MSETRQLEITIEPIGGGEVPEVPGGGVQYSLTVDSDPQGLLLTIDNTQMITTPYTQVLSQGTHTLKMPDATPDGRAFEQWEDGSTNPTRTINLTSDKTVKATYVVPKQYMLKVGSDPESLLFSINEMQLTTPYSQVLQEGTYTIKMPDATYDGRPFQDWEDGSTNPVRTITLDADKSVKATYQAAPVTPEEPVIVTPEEPEEPVEPVEPVPPKPPVPPVPVSACAQEYGDWGLLNGFRDFICTLQGISTKSE